MHKRSSLAYAVTYSPFTLPRDFPIHAGAPDLQTDRAITWLHRHNYFELGYCYEGSGIFIVENKVMPFRTGDATAINRYELHLAASARGTVSRWVWVMAEPELLLAVSGQRDYTLTDTAVLGGAGFNNVIKQAEHPVLCAGIRRLIDELNRQERGYRTLVKALMWEIMVQLHRLRPASPEPPRENPDSVAVIAPALSYCAQHFREKVAIRDLARVCNLSVPQFRRRFKAGTGKAPHAYLTNLRIRNACVLLATTDRQITEIGIECGYPTLSSFNRNFSSVTATTPRDYRKSAQNR